MNADEVAEEFKAAYDAGKGEEEGGRGKRG